jgi:hypothetical protein
MTRLVILCICTFLCVQLHAQSNASLQTERYLPLLHALNNRQVQQLLNKQPALQNILLTKQQALQQQGIQPVVQKLLWTDTDNNTIIGVLQSLSRQKQVQGLLQTIRQSHQLALYDTLNDTAFLRMAWLHDAACINYTLNTYLLHQAPRYPLIDAMDADTTATLFVQQWQQQLQQRQSSFYSPALQLSLFALHYNQRNEAIRYWPTQQSLNKAAYNKALQHDTAYPYSLILVPGAGGSDTTTRITTAGKYRCRLAVQQYLQKQAPFILVSGGYVHPFKTPFCEAVEMKRYLIDSLHIPEAAIIADPYARHTTTNLRNAARFVYWMQLPASKPMLIVTDNKQVRHILNMQPRCLKELGYIPYSNCTQLSAQLLQAWPSITALQADIQDPLDP